MWTKERPATPGWYWHRWERANISNVEVVRVLPAGDGKFTVLTTLGNRWQLETLGGEWRGPLAEPTSSTDIASLGRVVKDPPVPPWVRAAFAQLERRMGQIEEIQQNIVHSLAERVTGQSELLTQRAEKKA